MSITKLKSIAIFTIGFVIISGSVFASSPTPPLPTGNCFPVGTQILTGQNGETTQIEKLKVGDRIISFDEKSGKTVESQVTRTKISERDHLYTIETFDGKKVEVTADHPFYVGGKYVSRDKLIPHGYTRADDLKVGDKIYVFNPSTKLLSESSVLSTNRIDRVATVYALTVSNNSNFFASGIAVHNKNMTPPPPSVPLPTSKPWTCFPAGTKILMTDGTEKNIEDVKVGDKVTGYDGKGKSEETVLELESPIRDHLYKLTFEDGTSVRLTAEHPLFTKLGWKAILPEKTAEENPNLIVGRMVLGDRVLNKNDKFVTITGIQYIPGNVQTYNLRSVSKNNNFYADSYLAHNKGPGVEPVPCPAGTQVSWSNPSYYCGPVGGEEWHRVSGCCAWSGGGQTCGKWYACPTRNNPNKQCRDCVTEDPYCTPYNAQVQVGSCVPIPPPMKSATGYVWEDTNGNNIRDASDKTWTNVAAPKCKNVSVGMTILETEQINARPTATSTFTCPAVGNAPTSSPFYTSGAHPSLASVFYTLVPPTGYDCTQVAWNYKVCENAGCTASHTGSGTGCGAIIANYNGSFANTLDWRIGQQIPRTMTGVVHETSNPASCNNSGVLSSTGLTVKGFNGVVQTGTTANVNSSDGTYTVTGLFSNDQITSLCVNGNLSSATKSYQLACVKASTTSGTAFNCSAGSGACAVNCTPTTALANGDAIVSFGFTPISNDKWFTAIDGDIYGDNISAYVAASPLGGFSPDLINTASGTTVGGFGFSAGTIDTQSTGTDVSEKGGAAQRLAILPSYEPNDKWLNKFNFVAPQSATTAVPSANTFEEGKVYSFTVAQFNQVLSTGTYKFADGNNNAPAASIVYVLGSGTINITKDFVSANNNKTLLLVTTSDVNIAKDSGVSTSGYTVTGPSQIDLVIISQKDINLFSQYDAASSTYDKPLMIFGSLIASGSVNPDRNLGAIDNSSYPATSIRFYPYLMSLIQKYEIANSSAAGVYTGLATVDVQFDYGE